ncbi:MAG TPA: ATP synthase F0 subunit C [Candidatus Baltobacteraceae bacterium]|jgi:F-type H+-transporting ATPase subunit c|nr:ATP synthase F0 subunit C [Candidatus Baltobacteraceae bacterium]
MGSRVGWLKFLATAAVLFAAGSAWAAEAGPAGGGGGMSVGAVSVITGGFAMAIAAGIAALAQGRAISAALDGIARQPNAAPRIQVAMIIGLALIESLAIYVLLIALIIFFVKPFGG